MERSDLSMRATKPGRDKLGYGARKEADKKTRLRER